MLYGLRDVTATIECIPLIAASIMSKKLAAGGQRIVLDVKCGRGAFMKTPEQAVALANELVDIGCGTGVPTRAVLSQMDEPLGMAVGNAVEVEEALDMLESTGSYTAPAGSLLAYLRLCIELAAHGLEASGRAIDLPSARTLASEMITTGKAAVAFAAISAAQGGPATISDIRKVLPKASFVQEIVADTEGVISALDAETIGKTAVEMGAGRLKKTDQIDPAVGIILCAKTGDRVKPGDVLARLCLNDNAQAEAFEKRIKSAYTISQGNPSAVLTDLVIQTIVR